MEIRDGKSEGYSSDDIAKRPLIALIDLFGLHLAPSLGANPQIAAQTASYLSEQGLDPLRLPGAPGVNLEDMNGGALEERDLLYSCYLTRALAAPRSK